MFSQLLTPVSDSLGLSFLVALLPILTVLILLGLLRLPAWAAAAAALGVALAIAIGVWRMPVGLAFNAVANGAVFALWPVMWIVRQRAAALQYRGARPAASTRSATGSHRPSAQ